MTSKLCEECGARRRSLRSVLDEIRQRIDDAAAGLAGSVEGMVVVEVGRLNDILDAIESGEEVGDGGDDEDDDCRNDELDALDHGKEAMEAV